jgi:hypothetical protein
VSKPERPRGSHKMARSHPIRGRIALLLAIPLTSLVALWAFSAVTTLSGALQRSHFSATYNAIGLPANAVTMTIQAERAAAATFLTSPTSAHQQQFLGLAQRSDAAVAAFRKSALAPETKDVTAGEMLGRVEALGREFDVLGPLRERVRSGSATPVQIIDGYSEVSDTTIRLLTTLIGVDDVAVYQNTTGILQARQAIACGIPNVVLQDAMNSATITGSSSPSPTGPLMA